ncbi:hypothetical protein CYLTODRAFT_378725 [Cylindrobasidium torrendii FP15055 ss-10]|uniref:DUF6534 domain-containing protein n=1 Tax=Cylindrobasidium torrendii FP15055 ss-10 TaxID=1314674 RepID=A0A0D7B6L9_9AGAR|nr:hypothetical protein CYLTODRAFT_378725 [Cylindrobasidium torrendii FP15055 ss-10]
MDPSIQDTFGALLTGGLIAMTIYGITTLQVYFYYMTYNDPRALKITVALIWALDTLHSGFMCDSLHQYLITNYANPSAMAEGNWSLISSILVNVILATAVQIFFTVKIHTLCPPRYKWLVSSVIMVIVLAHFAFGLETVAQFYVRRTFKKLKDVKYIAVYPFGITAILGDVVVAAALCILLEQNRSEYADTNHLVTSLIGYAISRCLLTAAVAVVEIAMFMTRPTSFYPYAVDFVIGKLWANAFLASLNQRLSLRERTKDYTLSTGTSTGFQVAPRAFGGTTGATDLTSVNIRMPRGSDLEAASETDNNMDESPQIPLKELRSRESGYVL